MDSKTNNSHRKRGIANGIGALNINTLFLKMKKRELAVGIFLIFGLVFLAGVSLFFLSKTQKDTEKKKQEMPKEQSVDKIAVLPEKDFGDLTKILSQNQVSSDQKAFSAAP